MKTVFQIVLFLAFAGLFAGVGAGLENHRALKFTKAHASEPLSIIGIGVCKKFLGVIVISKDGSIHNAQGVSPEEAQAAAQTLPEENSTLLNIPCGAVDTTT
jgi:hypothetical protein